MPPPLPPTVDQEIQRAETMFQQAPPQAATGATLVSPTINYDHYFKVRDREAAELKLRRDRQLEMLKWSSALLAGLIVAVPNLLVNVPANQQASIRLRTASIAAFGGAGTERWGQCAIS